MSSPALAASPAFFRRSILPRWPALLAWAALPLLILAMPRAYHGNDDVLIIEVLRGGHPAPFISDVLALVLVCLYKAVPSMPWYGWLLYGVTCATAHVAAHVVRAVFAGPGVVRASCRAMAAVLLLFTMWLLSSRLTFTIAAISAIGVACVAFAVDCRREVLTWKRGVLYGLLIAVGYALRPASSFAVAGAIGLPGLLFLLWFVWRRRQAFAVAFLACAAPIALAVAVNGVAPAAFSADEVAYREYNNARGAIQGFDKYKALDLRNPDAIKEAGWTKWNYRSFMLMINFNEDRYPLEKLRTLEPTALIPPKPPLDALADLSFYMSIFVWILPVGVVACSLFFGGNRRGRNALGVIFVWGQVAYLAAVLCYFALAMRVVPRVAMPMVLVGSLVALVVGWWTMGEGWMSIPWERVKKGGISRTFARTMAVPAIAALLAFIVRTWAPFESAWGAFVSPTVLAGILAALACGWSLVGWGIPWRQPDWLGSLQVRARLAAGVLVVVGLLPYAVKHWMTFEVGFAVPIWKRHATLAETIRTHVPDPESKVFVEYTCITGFSNGVDPLSSADPLPYRAVFLEWVPPSPFFYDCLRQAGIKRGADLLPAGYARAGEILFLLEDQFLPQFEQYAQGELGKVVHFEKAYDFAWPSLDLYKLVDGPSSQFELPGRPPGNIFYPNEKIQSAPFAPRTPAAPPAAPPR